MHILFNNGTLNSALKTIGPEILLRLLDEKRISGTFFSDMLATLTNTIGDVQFHNYTAILISKGADGKNYRPEDWAFRIFDHALGKGPDTKKFAKRFLEAVPIRFLQKRGEPPVIGDAAKRDLEDRNMFKTRSKSFFESQFQASNCREIGSFTRFQCKTAVLLW